MSLRRSPRRTAARCWPHGSRPTLSCRPRPGSDLRIRSRRFRRALRARRAVREGPTPRLVSDAVRAARDSGTPGASAVKPFAGSGPSPSTSSESASHARAAARHSAVQDRHSSEPTDLGMPEPVEAHLSTSFQSLVKPVRQSNPAARRALSGGLRLLVRVSIPHFTMAAMSRESFHRLRQTRAARIVGVYAATAWGVFEIIDKTVRTFGWSEVIPRTSLVLLIVGLVVVTFTAWAYAGQEVGESTGWRWPARIQGLLANRWFGRVAIAGLGVALLLWGWRMVRPDVRYAPFSIPELRATSQAPRVAVLPVTSPDPRLEQQRRTLLGSSRPISTTSPTCGRSGASWSPAAGRRARASSRRRSPGSAARAGSIS